MKLNEPDLSFMCEKIKHMYVKEIYSDWDNNLVYIIFGCGNKIEVLRIKNNSYTDMKLVDLM